MYRFTTALVGMTFEKAVADTAERPLHNACARLSEHAASAGAV